MLQLSGRQAAKQPLTSLTISLETVPKSREVIFSIYSILTGFLQSGNLWSEEVTGGVQALEPSMCDFWARSAWRKANMGQGTSSRPLQGCFGIDGPLQT